MPGDVWQITRKCKLSLLLHSPFKQYQQVIRTITEEYSILRHDALNLALYSVCFWTEGGYRENESYSSVMEPTFWSHCYRTVALGEGHVSRTVIPPISLFIWIPI
ncbi:uncharacterized protein RHIMIDRAFT_276370 [Rhizopus microsporus ATCC 52813]|uniref:Uncharacterized protein n=1 Tax=Rhizopus microsporus ATCC 52813 TaxID=1340429 RepID=A0A2G4T1F0_RHIZD|nr:uncharacterized protein RHIMIDRAFT_276370 [Rhizopus microsporus ATCC 52813]PHZ14821.1 hypothetical protein RHIMIDRAFT_276370 [Rhizopus microsporus ATCC 52813]